MKTIKEEKIESLIDKNKELKSELENLQSRHVELDRRLNQIYNAKSFKIWQIFNRVKKDIFSTFIKRHSFFNTDELFLKPKKQSYTNNITELVSIIIPTRNGGALWEKNLDLILKQKNIPNKEIIVLDNNSTDNTCTYAKQKKCKVYKIPENEFGHGKTRAYGVTKATGKYLIYTVQDATPTSLYAYCNLVNFAKKHNLSAVSGVQTPHDDADSFAKWQNYYHYINLGFNNNLVINGKKINQEKYIELSPQQKREILCIDDVIACYKRSDLVKNNFSTETNFAEDLEVAQRFINDNKKIGITNQTIVKHSHNSIPLYIFKRSYIESMIILQILNNKRCFHQKIPKILKDSEVLTILLLVKAIIENPNTRTIDILSKPKKLTDGNPMCKLLDKTYPNWKSMSVKYNKTLVEKLKYIITPIWDNYQNYSETLKYKKKNIFYSKLVLNILGNYLASIVYHTNNRSFDDKIKNLIDQRV